jgi:hypothetical protein
VADFKNIQNDMVIENGELVWVTGQEAIKQHIEMRLKTWLGETVYDQSAVVPYLQVIFVKSTPLDSVQFILTSVVEETPGVTGAELAVELDSITRVLTVTGNAQTIDGDVDFSITASPNQTET